MLCQLPSRVRLSPRMFVGTGAVQIPPTGRLCEKRQKIHFRIPPASCRVVFQPSPSRLTHLCSPRYYRLYAVWRFSFNLCSTQKTRWHCFATKSLKLKPPRGIKPVVYAGHDAFFTQFRKLLGFENSVRTRML